MTFRYGTYVEDDELVEHARTKEGIWLRYHYNGDIVKLVKKTGNKRLFETVERVVVREYDGNIVWLEIWCKNIFDTLFGKHRYNVFYVTSLPQAEWSCHGDLGKGLIE